MFPKINPAETSAWEALIVHQTQMKKVQLKDLFKNDSHLKMVKYRF
ncbi:hypothetical protein QGN23_06295 [Chryseobacterium gotjawalense]|uniref:Uncharacterized protein n=1 Tax=Chryseobacterium gotjawalense TaxID=3042315 RepID=A0ABY8RHS4_9FLAO|nr:hypothetical protein [Chryseobacterium sp. wdc7]WHF52887.1 hypothetical protein QGN23_06295 [Chryseobacterium sp. wdc7]